jgi:diguanylate cyclase (GGDEF)-like protein
MSTALSAAKPFPLGRILRMLAALALLLAGMTAWSKPLDLSGQWYEAPSNWHYDGRTALAGSQLTRVTTLNKTGGHYFLQADFALTHDQANVIDFKNSSVINYYHHWIFDESGQQVAELQGGVQISEENPYFLRHGRDLNLPAGRYRLVSEVDSPFFLAQPTPYIDTREHYQQSIKPGNALTILCMGVLLGLAFYYVALAITRRNLTDALYCLFLLGNLLYNGTALLVYPDLFGMHWFYLISMPILFSNIAYVFFVLRLLNINRDAHPRLYSWGVATVYLFLAFLPLAAAMPNWSLELDRTGVALFMSFGLGAGILRTRQGDVTARHYLVAVITFFILGVISISLSKLDGSYTFYIEHLGLLAVTVEALLLALVLAGQFALLRRQFELEHEYATRDPLTGLQNRRAFLEGGNIEVERSKRYSHPLAVIFLDLDNFKKLNDTEGHDVGDAALQDIAKALLNTLRANDLVARLGGDEFSIMLPEVEYEDCVIASRKISHAIKHALLNYPPVTSSIGVTWYEQPDRDFGNMMKAADELMYQAKSGGKDNMIFKRFDTELTAKRQA